MYTGEHVVATGNVCRRFPTVASIPLKDDEVCVFVDNIMGTGSTIKHPQYEYLVGKSSLTAWKIIDCDLL